MAQPAIQTSFASGEWAPKLRSRVDIQKYHLGAALLRNFYVDYSGGGASTRAGSRFIAKVGANGARLIPFQPSTNLAYVLEFGAGYIRFFSNGAQILSGGNPYQISSPYAAADLFPNPATGNPGLKFVQDVNSLIICHPNYNPQILTINSPTNWTLTQITFGTSIGTPSSVAFSTTLGAGSWNYSYLVTAVDVNGQESSPSAAVGGAGILSLSITAGSNSISWAGVSGAASYNVYKAAPTFTTAIPAGTVYGFIGNTNALSFVDAQPGFAPDFAQTPPTGENPFQGAVVQSFNVVTKGTYTTAPTAIVAAPPAGGSQATAQVSLGIISFTIATSGTNFVAGQINNVTDTGGGIVWATLNILTVGGSGQILTASVAWPGSITSGSVPPNNLVVTHPGAGTAATITATWGIVSVIPVQNGSGYTSAPLVTVGPYATGIAVTGGTYTSGSGAVTLNTATTPLVGDYVTVSGATGTGSFASINGTYLVTGVSAGVSFTYTIATGLTMTITGATAAYAAQVTAVLGPISAGNPGVPGFIQERLVLANQPKNVQGFNFSQPGSPFNFNTTFPVQPDDAISGDIAAEDLNDIRSLIGVPTGMLALTGKAAWLLNGGGGISTMVPITPTNIVAQPQAFNGANDVKPIKINMDILYITNKGNYVRDLVYNLYMQIFTGMDITTFSNHLFFGYYLNDWAWSEEPFKTLWAIRNDGILISLGFVKEQDLIGWAHHDTNGQYKSVCSVIETNVGGGANTVDAVYTIVERVLNGVVTQCVERMADRFFYYGIEDAWCVDCGLQTAPSSSPTGLLTITGNASAVGNSVTLTDTADVPFTAAMATNNFIVRAGGGIYKITAFTSTSVVTAQVVRVPTSLNPYTNSAYSVLGFGIWTPVTTVSGLTYLNNMAVVGLADGNPISGTVSGGSLALGGTYTKVVIGLAYTPQLQTLPLDLGEPTIQSKRKKITAATLRVADTLGLSIGTSFANVVPMKDFTIGNVGTQSNLVVTDLVTGDGRTILDQYWQEPGQLCIQQNSPFPATILGVIPEVVVGDTSDKRPG